MSIRSALPSSASLVLSVSVVAGSAVGQQGAPSSHWRERQQPAPPPALHRNAAGLDVPLGGTNEPAVAVNPLDSRNVAMSSLFEYRVSGDGGNTWTPPSANHVPSGYLQDGDPSLGFDHLGRLFYCYQGYHAASGGADEFVARLNPTTGAYISGPFKISVSGTIGNYNDKCWLAVDHTSSSPFAGRLYAAWTEFPTSGGTRVLFSSSGNQGATWSAPLPLSTFGEGFVWPAHVAVAPNGEVFVSYHSQTGFNGIGEAGGNPDGVSGKVFVVRSMDGGFSFPQKTLAFGAGEADLTYNVQSSPGTIPGTAFWLQGSGQAWVLPDPHVAGRIYVVAADDPDNMHGVGDDATIRMVTSLDSGVSWSSPMTVDAGPGTSFQVMPTASIDEQTGCILVAWYDNRDGFMNGAGHFLLHLYSRTSCDDGLSFQPEIRISDLPFDPDLGAPTRFFGPPATVRIGEYIDVSAGGGDLYAVWTGNTGTGQQIISDSILSVGGVTPYCYGDGSLSTNCPCFNFGTYRNGCANSSNPSGAALVSTGDPLLDSVVLTSSGERPTSLSIFLQGTIELPQGVIFGDGLRCVGGTLKRLYVKAASAGIVTAPGSGDPSIRVRSSALGDTIPSGSMRFYQVYYRDPSASFCSNPPGDTFNVSNGFRILWP